MVLLVCHLRTLINYRSLYFMRLYTIARASMRDGAREFLPAFPHLEVPGFSDTCLNKWRLLVVSL